MQELLFQKGINWNDYPARFKRGTYLRRQKVKRQLSEDERLQIPEKHRPPEDLLVERTDIVTLDLPPIRKISNRVDVFFFAEEPVLYADR